MELTEKQKQKIEIRDLQSLGKSLYGDLQKNARMMNGLLVRVDENDEAAIRRLNQFKHEQLYLAEKIYRCHERLDELGEVLELKWPLNRFAEKQRKWIESVGRPQ
jgi:hypothetical protein